MHAVLFLIDPSREWTFSYVKSQLPSIPPHIDVLLLLNFRDLPDSERTAVTCTTVEQYMRGVGDRVRYVECSMRNGYGLKHIQSFLNIPFLHLKRERLRQEIRELEREVEGAAAELELMSEMDYTSYCKWLTTQVAEREKDMTEEERKIELEKRIQQERLMLLLAAERKKDEEKKALLIQQEKDKQQKERERLQAEERKRVEKEAKKKKSSSSTSSTAAANTAALTHAQPSLVIDKAKERLELEKEKLDDFQVDDNNDDFFGEPTTNPTLHNELQARQDRTRPAERAEEEEEGMAEEDELDVGGRVANGLSEQKELEEAALEDDDMLEEPAWELDEPVAAYASPFGIGYGGGGGAVRAAEDREREKREAREREKKAEREREQEKDKERERRAAEKRQKEEQREREMEERIRKEKEEEAQKRAQPSQPQQHAEQDASAEEDELVDDANTFRRPVKQYSFDDEAEDDATAGPVFDDDDDGDNTAAAADSKRSIVLDDQREASVEASKHTDVVEEADELDMDFSSIHLRQEDNNPLDTGAATKQLPRLDSTYAEEVRRKREEEEKQREEVKKSLIFVPTASAPAVPDADLDIFGVAGGGDAPRKEKERVRGKEMEKGREKSGKRKDSNEESANGTVVLDSFYGGLLPHTASTASSTASTTANSPRTHDSKKDKKHSRVKRSDREGSSDDQLDLFAPQPSKTKDSKKDSRGREKERDREVGREKERGGKRRTVRADEGLEDDLELDQPLDIAAEIENAKKERDRKEKEAREVERRKEKERDKAKEKEKDGAKKSRRTVSSSSESDDEEEERRRKKKDKDRKKDRSDKEKGRDRKREESDRRKRKDDSSEAELSERSDEEDRTKRKAKKERERERGREKEKEEDKKKNKKKDKHSKHSDSDQSTSSADDRSSKPRKGRRKDAMDAFYDDDETFSGKRVAASVPAPVVVSGMGGQPSVGQSRSVSSSGGFFSNLLRSSK